MIAIGADYAVLAVVAVIALADINAFVAKLAFFRKGTINAILAYTDPKTIITILVQIVANYHVRIFTVCMVWAIIGVFALCGQNTWSRPRFS
jgi:hypothetical protein